MEMGKKEREATSVFIMSITARAPDFTVYIQLKHQVANGKRADALGKQLMPTVHQRTTSVFIGQEDDCNLFLLEH